MNGPEPPGWGWLTGPRASMPELLPRLFPPPHRSVAGSGRGGSGREGADLHADEAGAGEAPQGRHVDDVLAQRLLQGLRRTETHRAEVFIRAQGGRGVLTHPLTDPPQERGGGSTAKDQSAWGKGRNNASKDFFGGSKLTTDKVEINVSLQGLSTHLGTQQDVGGGGHLQPPNNPHVRFFQPVNQSRVNPLGGDFGVEF